MAPRYLTFSRPTRRHWAISVLVLAVMAVGLLAFRGLGRWLMVRDTLPERVDVIFAFGGETARETYALRLSEQHPEATLVISAPSKVRTRTLLGAYLDASRSVIVDSLKNTWEEVKFLRGWLEGYRAERAKAASVAAESDSLNAILAQVGGGGDGPSGNPKSKIQNPNSAIRDPHWRTEVRGERSEVRVRDGLLHEKPDSALGEREARTIRDPQSPIRSRRARSASNPQSAISVALVSGPYHMRRIKVAAVRMLRAKDLRLYYTPAPLELYRQTEEQYAHWWREPAVRSLVRIEFGKTMYYLVRL